MVEPFWFTEAEDLLRLTPQQQKGLAEFLLICLYEDGWDITWDDGELSAVKTEYL